MREKLISDECYGLISKPDFILSFFIKTRHGNSPQSVHGFYHVFSCNVYKITYKYTVYIYIYVLVLLLDQTNMFNGNYM